MFVLSILHTLEFQSLIGKLQTWEKEEEEKNEKRVFQSLIGKLQTRLQSSMARILKNSFNPL